MPLPISTWRYPHKRVLLQRTRLAYVHLRNLLTDAKRDRAARVWGYVAIAAWIRQVIWAAAPAGFASGLTPEHLLGELTHDRRHVFQSAGLFSALPWKVAP